MSKPLITPAEITDHIIQIKLGDNQFPAIEATDKTTGNSIVDSFGLANTSSFILIIGSGENFSDEATASLTRLFQTGIIPAASSCKSIIIDGGTDAGVMRLTGKSANEEEFSYPIIGIAPKSKVDYLSTGEAGLTPLEPNHSHFLLTPGKDWGSETRLMFDLIQALLNLNQLDTTNIKTSGSLLIPSRVTGVCILAGGGVVAKKELLKAVQANLPIIIIKGSGKLADEIANAYADRTKTQQDCELAQIISEGILHFFELGKCEKGIEKLIYRELRGESILLKAWKIFSDYDHNANRHQKRHYFIQGTIIILGISSATLAVIWKHLGFTNKDTETSNSAAFWHTLLILSPILTTLMIAAANKFKAGQKWLFLRAGAENIKREIYAYRTRSGEYAADADHLLAERIKNITKTTMRTEANHSSLDPYDQSKGFPPYMFASLGTDDGFSMLTPDGYIKFRLEDQIRYYTKTTVRLDRKVNIFSWGGFIVAAIATYLSFTEYQLWIAVTAAIVAAIGAYMGYNQYEMLLIKYNQGRTDLENIRNWWDALTTEEQYLPENFADLVKHTEQTLKNEFDGWLQQMENNLSNLKSSKEKKDKPPAPGTVAANTNA